MNARSASLALYLLAALPAAQDDGPTAAARFAVLDAAGDLDGVVALWRAHEDEILYTIDADLEGALSLWEDDPDANAAAIAALHERALRGALAADRATGRAIFSDYTSSFIGWNPADKHRFREGKRLYTEASGAIRSAAWEDGLRLARESVAIALPLGDWWGAATARTACGAALEGLGRSEEALAEQSRARLLFQQLGLPASELRNLVAMARLLDRLDRRPRAQVTIEHGLALARRLGIEPAMVSLLRTRAELEQRAGELEDARATLSELKALLEEMRAGG